MKFLKKIILVFLLFSNSSYGQNYKITYQVNFTPYSYDLSKEVSELGVLYINSNVSSSYASENFFKQDSIFNLVYNNSLTFGEATEGLMKYKTKLYNFVLKNYKDNELVTYEQLSIERLFYTQKNQLKWTLKPDTLTVNKFKCNLAITHFEGRDYKAWYTNEIPISDGPYKFSGLPGLIVKIEDLKKEYSFTLLSFEKYSGDIPSNVSFAHEAIHLSHEKYKTRFLEYLDDPRTPLARAGIKTRGETLESARNKPGLVSNPIELYSK